MHYYSTLKASTLPAINTVIWLLILGFSQIAQAQTPPALSCGSSSLRHDWDVNTWPAGSLAESFTTSGETLNVTISGDTGFFQPDTTSAPIASNFDTGGLTPAELSLELFVDFDISTRVVNVTIDIGDSGTGVEELQFSIFDLDFGDAQFQDQVIVSGSLNGIASAVTLTDGVANTVSGSTITGQIAADSTSSDGTVVVTFQNPVDQVVFSYSNGATAPSDPGTQAISIHDIFTCPRLLPNLSGSKTVDVHDALSQGLYSIPGNDVVYTISANNSGTAPTDTDSIVLIDALPAEITFYNADIDDAGPETDAVSFIQSNSPSLTFNYSTDVKFSDASTAPTGFNDCAYTPTNGYDPNINYVCLNPKGQLDFGTPTPSFSLQFRARIN